MLVITNKLAAASARRAVVLALAVLCVAGFVSRPAPAQDTNRWVTDELEITMRTGKSTRQSIVRVLKSGTRVELLELDRDAGYALVRTRGGAEGWVLSRYLLRQPPARVRMPNVEKQLEQAQAARKEIQQQLGDVRKERDQLKRRVAELERSGGDTETELRDLKRLSANVIQVDQDNQQLRERLAATDQRLVELERENERLGSRSAREWFVVGAGVVVFGMVLGLILPRIRWRRKSSWSDF